MKENEEIEFIPVDRKKHKNLVHSNIDVIFKEVGEFGRYQLLVFILVGSIVVVCAIAAYQPVFMDATPQHRCKIPGIYNDTFEITSQSHQQLIDTLIPFNLEKNRYERCYIFNNFTNATNSVHTASTCSEWVCLTKYYRYDTHVIMLFYKF